MNAGVMPTVAEQARELYRESVAAEMPLSGRHLADQFDRSESWGRARIRETRAAEGNALPVASPPVGLPHSGNVQASDPALPGDSEPVADSAPPVVPQPSATTATSDAAVKRQPRGARAVVWTAFLLGIAASVAANIAHADAAAGPRVAAAFAPVALLLAVECMSRPTWYRTGWRWSLARYGGTGLVALVAAVMSYRHMHGLLLDYGEDALGAAIGPLVVDGLMITAGFALLAMTPPRGPRSTDTPTTRKG